MALTNKQLERNMDITPENVFDVNIKELALDKRFGSLMFEDANKKLSKVQGWLKEAHDLGFQDLLLGEGVTRINSFTKQLVDQFQG